MRGPRQRQCFADGQGVPQGLDLVEFGEQRLGHAIQFAAVHGVSELPTTAVASMPGRHARSREPLRACRVLPPERAEPTATPAGRIASTMGDREERASVAAGSKLTENAACNLEVPFDHKVHDVMREPRVITWSVRHVQHGAAAPVSRNRVAPLPGPGEDDLHGTNYAPTVALLTLGSLRIAIWGGLPFA
jgi:hypothetical protein